MPILLIASTHTYSQKITTVSASDSESMIRQLFALEIYVLCIIIVSRCM